MNDKLFVIAIGGTGMRCLESFVHLCAIGMFDGQEIDILTIDTDSGNGNKDRSEKLIALYNDIKTPSKDKIGGTPNRQTFFSAKLNLYKYSTDYAGNRCSFRNLANIGDEDSDNQDLADLFLDKESVQKFDLAHGYRAQTHLGSMLMYHGIVEAAQNAQIKGNDAMPVEKDLREFVVKLQDAGAGARVFIFGSVFGGTGASSIPVVPRALNDAVKIFSDGNNSLDPENVKFGASLLTDYFKFPNPDTTQKSKEKVIANSSNFALNSQAALEFYRKDPTVKTYYRRLYHVGWPASMRKDISGGKLLTGGNDQKNPCHVVELMCAMAAYDFFTQQELAVEVNAENMPCYYRTVEADDAGKFFKFTADSFTKENARIFHQKLAQMFSLANVVLASEYAAYGKPSTAKEKYGIQDFISRISDAGDKTYDSLDANDIINIEDYLKMFAFYINAEKQQVVPGWLYQVKDSIDGGKFIFRNDAFIHTVADFKRIAKNPGTIFDDNEAEKNWAKGGLISSQYDIFIKGLCQDTQVKQEQNTSSIKEQFLAYLYNAIRLAHHFES